MHPHFAFTARQILWTLTFAAQLLLLIVILGRDRVRRFPLFTAAVSLYALRLLAEVLLSGRLATIPLDEILLTLADLGALLSLLVLIEVARRAFAGMRWQAWTAGTAVLALAAGGIEWAWGPWPQWQDLADHSLLGILRLMSFFAQKMDLFTDLLTIGLGVLIVAVGGRFAGGWRSHAQKIAIGLATVSASWLTIQRSWQLVANKAHPHSQQEYEQLMGLGAKLVNANKVVYIAALVWWIWWLWREENGAAAMAAAAAEVPTSEESVETAEASVEKPATEA